MEADEKTCPRCAETVKAAALVCKHCGHEFAPAQRNIASPASASSLRGVTQPAANPAPKGRTFLVVAAIIVGVIILLAVLGAVVGPQQQSNAPVAEQTGATTGVLNAPADGAPAAEGKSASTAPASTAVTSVELAKAYNANEVAAQKTYGDRALDVSGTITGVTLDIFNNPVIQMEGVNAFLPVQATFDKSFSDKISALSKGDRITVRCTAITEVISAPQLSDCTLPE